MLFVQRFKKRLKAARRAQRHSSLDDKTHTFSAGHYVRAGKLPERTDFTLCLRAGAVAVNDGR